MTEIFSTLQLPGDVWLKWYLVKTEEEAKRIANGCRAYIIRNKKYNNIMLYIPTDEKVTE